MTTDWHPAERNQVAEDDPARPRTVAALRAALEDVLSPDDEFSLHLAIAAALLRSELLRSGISDPWDLLVDLS